MTTTETADSKDAAAARLRLCRIAAGYRSGRAAARANGWTYSTYMCHETGQRSFGVEEAEAYGAAYGVTAAYLLFGAGKVNGELSNPADISLKSHDIRKLPLIDGGNLSALFRITMGSIPQALDGAAEPFPSWIDAGPRTFAARPSDDALASVKIFEATMCYFDPDAPFKSGDIVIAIVDGFPSAVVRKYRAAVGAGAFELVSPNDDFPGFTTAQHKINVVGKLVGAMIRF